MTGNTRRGVLFDLDGTLVHTAPDLVGALNDMLREDGLAPVAFEELAPYCSFGGRGMLGRGYGITPEAPIYRETYDRYIAGYKNRMTRESHPYAGIRELIRKIVDNGMVWGIVTNKAEALALMLLDHIGFDPAPSCIIGGDTAAAPKPDPAPLLLACERAALEPENCIYVGDSDRDIMAGHAAHMKAIAAGYGYVPGENPVTGWRADAIVQSTRDLWPAIQTLFPD